MDISLTEPVLQSPTQFVGRSPRPQEAGNEVKGAMGETHTGLHRRTPSSKRS